MRTLVLLLLVSACGAKTGLRVPTLRFDAAVQDAPDDAPDVQDAMRRDVPYVCVPGRVSLLAREGDVVFVVDRSGSMAFGIQGEMAPPRGGASRWSLLTAAFRSTLPAFEDTLNVGGLFYPQTGIPGSQACALPDIPELDVAPQRDGGDALLRILSGTQPNGSTPTYAALRRAYTWTVRNPSRTRARYLVLATDGGPNCNAALDPATCDCTTPRGGRGCGPIAGATQCLDHARTIDLLSQIANNPASSVPVYVIGIAPDASGAAAGIFDTILTSMARAGGRPRIDARGNATYYSVRREGDFAQALSEIQSSIARCAFVTPSLPDRPDRMRVQLGGTPVPRDLSHVDGWDWTDQSNGEITLFGAACTRAIASVERPFAEVGCEDAGF